MGHDLFPFLVTVRIRAIMGNSNIIMREKPITRSFRMNTIATLFLRTFFKAA